MTMEETLLEAKSHVQQILDNIPGWKEQATMLWMLSPAHYMAKVGAPLDKYLEDMDNAAEKARETICRIETRLARISTEKVVSET